jgi:hypothetical protein
MLRHRAKYGKKYRFATENCDSKMTLIFRSGDIEIWTDGPDFLVFGVTDNGDAICCPSLGMAHEVAARNG